jgi:hypothetical protein
MRLLLRWRGAAAVGNGDEGRVALDANSDVPRAEPGHGGERGVDGGKER